jgi:hypothetical protein
MEVDKKQVTEISLKNQDIISSFDKDAGFVFVYKKTEKLASAVYMITNLFVDNEPMKWTLRKKVSELVSFVVNYKDVKDTLMSDFVYTTKTKVLEVVSMLEISMRAGLISSMNFSILKSEFSSLVDVLNSEISKPKDSNHELISSSFFEVKDYQNKAVSSSDFSSSGFRVSPVNVKDNQSLVTKDEFKRSNRQNIILGLIKKKKELTIKDIAQVIKDCSEKTIQRELISFIKAGVLKRVGERRWSKYSLV